MHEKDDFVQFVYLVLGKMRYLVISTLAAVAAVASAGEIYRDCTRDLVQKN